VGFEREKPCVAVVTQRSGLHHCVALHVCDDLAVAAKRRP